MMRGGVPGIELLVLAVFLVVSVILAVPHYFYWRRTGHSGWWCLLMLVPGVNILSVWMLALKAWPIDRHRD